ncbi:hypothetical protein F4820DRAFT_464576 [Hypoxylon rubiginosum]|uniref:Uncharacterized protein n=1 Tax=Hypoxylon rubiginosum TaxID=110542 RepID=A0ACB9YR08_9PEZI|nr:hypothetical protein F4820DRAFT_464576 [Hypoxylon rubiginosum]
MAPLDSTEFDNMSLEDQQRQKQQDIDAADALVHSIRHATHDLWRELGKVKAPMGDAVEVLSASIRDLLRDCDKLEEALPAIAHIPPIMVGLTQLDELTDRGIGPPLSQVNFTHERLVDDLDEMRQSLGYIDEDVQKLPEWEAEETEIVKDGDDWASSLFDESDGTNQGTKRPRDEDPDETEDNKRVKLEDPTPTSNDPKPPFTNTNPTVATVLYAGPGLEVLFPVGSSQAPSGNVTPQHSENLFEGGDDGDVVLGNVPADDIPATDEPIADVPTSDVPTPDVPTPAVPAGEMPASDVPASDDESAEGTIPPGGDDSNNAAPVTDSDAESDAESDSSNDSRSSDSEESRPRGRSPAPAPSDDSTSDDSLSDDSDSPSDDDDDDDSDYHEEDSAKEDDRNDYYPEEKAKERGSDDYYGESTKKKRKSKEDGADKFILHGLTNKERGSEGGSGLPLYPNLETYKYVGPPPAKPAIATAPDALPWPTQPARPQARIGRRLLWWERRQKGTSRH